MSTVLRRFMITPHLEKRPSSWPVVKRALAIIGLFSVLAWASVQTGLGQEQAWPLPTLPPGANPAVIATPKQDWLVRVQATLDRTRGKQFDLVFDGDSITDGWQGVGKDIWTEHYAPLNAIDFGISGDRTENVLWRLQHGQVDGMNPKLIVLMIGTNNMGRDKASQIVEGIKAIVVEYEKRCPDAHILLLGIFPRGQSPTDPNRAKISDVNKQITSLDDGKRVTYLDIGSKFLQPDGTLSNEIMPDFLHPSMKGYQIWVDAIHTVVDLHCPKSK